jgi:hypothetical protein
MDKERVIRLAEVQRREVEEIDNEEEFSKPKSGPDPEHQETEVKQVVQDEMASNVACSSDKVDI